MNEERLTDKIEPIGKIVDECSTKTVELKHDGVVVGTAQVSIYGDLVGMELNTEGTQLFIKLTDMVGFSTE